MMGGGGDGVEPSNPSTDTKGGKYWRRGGGRGGGLLNLASLPMLRSPFQGCQRIFAQYILKRESSNFLIK